MRSAGQVGGIHYDNDLPSIPSENPTRPSCTLADCTRPLYSKGMCRNHYQRAWSAAKKKAEEAET